ncbi:fasciclin domain-containing protein [Constantimarinum furrinae]|uniref:FAS1 domain-containing protein n=1 Tax=Constantimarinum furrinae TaxID=2562285 RepID=A0A7G8PR75_9FLAO|nr:fasciclin domain-containing protein [Constantimarinum furrinae]QNJ96841.1 hypothetical protein ALE3EI_0252 [Constantimarinum furrinae]
MKKWYPFVFFFTLIFMLSACKNEKNEKSYVVDNSEKRETDSLQNIRVQEEKQERISQANSVMAKVMATKETSTFSSLLVTSGMSESLLKEKGPYTILAPTNEAFDKLDEEKRMNFTKPEFKNEMIALVKNHIIEGDIDSVAMVQNIKSGSYSITTLGGKTLKVTKNGSDIIFTTDTGKKAVLGKSDIKGTNGELHLVDTVLAFD